MAITGEHTGCPGVDEEESGWKPDLCRRLSKQVHRRIWRVKAE